LIHRSTGAGEIIQHLKIIDQGPYYHDANRAYVGSSMDDQSTLPANVYFDSVNATNCFKFMCPSELKVRIQNLATYLNNEGTLSLEFTFGKKHLHDGVKQAIRFDEVTFTKFFERLQDLSLEQIEKKETPSGEKLRIALKKTRQNNRQIKTTLITDPNDERVADFKTRRDVQAKRKGLILIDSEKCVLRLIESKTKIHKILGLQDYILKYDRYLENLENTEILEARLPVMEGIINGKIHQGMMAIAERPTDCKLTELGDRIVVLDGLNDGHNVGCIVRSAHAFGFTGVLCDDHGCSPLVRRAVRVSMGSIFKAKVRHCENLEGDLLELKKLGYHITGAENYETSVELATLPYQEKLVLVIGNEDQGIHEGVRDVCDSFVKIPVSEDIDSLNAATAASVLMYQLRKM
jgi:tRNA G18 (ribose-2'-O)-methylase SpoU